MQPVMENDAMAAACNNKVPTEKKQNSVVGIRPLTVKRLALTVARQSTTSTTLVELTEHQEAVSIPCSTVLDGRLWKY
jgi:hypothetical protein